MNLDYNILDLVKLNAERAMFFRILSGIRVYQPLKIVWVFCEILAEYPAIYGGEFHSNPHRRYRQDHHLKFLAGR